MKNDTKHNPLTTDNTQATETMSLTDTSWTSEIPTPALRWLLQDDRYNPMLQHKVLQQKWEIYTHKQKWSHVMASVWLYILCQKTK